MHTRSHALTPVNAPMMKPLSENSLPYTESDNSARDARHGRNTTASTVSCHSNHYDKSVIEDGVQMHDFSSPAPSKSRGKSPDPNRFVAERPPRINPRVGTGLTVPKADNSSFEDQAASEWETVAGDDASESYPEASIKPLRRQGNFLGYSPQNGIPQNNHNVWAPQTESFELVSHSGPSVRVQPRSSPRLHSFNSSSSFYSDLSKQSGNDANIYGKSPIPCDPEDFPTDNRAQQQTKRYSHASSDSHDDPFKYDNETYSGFLRPSAERENVDEEVKVPVHREGDKDTRRAPIPDRRLTGEIAALDKNRPLTGTEGDWQTVTSEQVLNSMQQEYLDSIAKGTGSSLADVSDVTERGHQLRTYSSTDRIIRHPYGDNPYDSYHIRRDRGTNLAVSVPRYGDGPGTFASNTARKFVQPMSRLPESAARFSNIFRRDQNEQTPDGILLSDLDPNRASYQSLDSDAIPNSNTADSNLPNGQRFFSWNRIRETLGREPPKTPLTILDQPLYRHGIQDSDNSNKSKHIPHDNFLKELPSLPFPLVSLPEAQMLQQFKRQRGEEDHTESAGNFAARGRSNTISTAASPGLPVAPSPPKRSFWAISPESSVARPAPTHQPKSLRQRFRRRDSSERISEMLVSSSAILDTPPSAKPQSSTHRTWYRGQQPSFSTPRAGQSQPRGFSSSIRSRRFRPDSEPLDGSPFTLAETRLIEEARENMFYHRQRTDMVAQRGKRLFIWIMILTLFFPFIGPVVLYGKLNSTISWYTHGEIQCLTQDQRGILKQQLVVEAVLYTALIIALSVHYSIYN
ncbi:hypothetical protein FPSE_12046 [Fusarium pseudograminearum CS3096]|uniref:Uncharacterized protein n=1 Tax=Fusarium pseudograminearum (strain CS3096) TaxID=1028729 RepID=K3V4L6_FUSPC|nr:hypothetical protein FPSE_12046 [Fusarium pseudograminearum CS3096]EKJ67774.1 hypothetical protein FPSE_12046 [Fusarium pseudograminearum CS3096]